MCFGGDILGCTDLTEKYNLMLGDVMIVSRNSHTLTPSKYRMPLPEVLMSLFLKVSIFKTCLKSLLTAAISNRQHDR